MSLGKSDGGLPPDDVIQTEAEILEDTERLVDEYHDPDPGAMVRISLAPCSPFSVTPEEMRATARLAEERGLQIHTHLAETLDEEKFCLETYGLRPAAYLDSLGWITDNAWFAHSIHINDDEIEQLAGAGSSISHCPTSNMRLGSGIAPVKKLLEAGAGVSLGVDGSASNDSSNMLAEIRNALLLSRLRPETEWLTAREVLFIATRGGANALGRDDIGSLETGKRADLALFDMSGLEYAGGLSDPLAALVFGVRMKPVDWLIVDGNIVVRNGTTGVDEAKLAYTQREIADEMLRSASERTGVAYKRSRTNR
jgi:cytosine/adenosine deaminase-related metal-dependent hydrolase